MTCSVGSLQRDSILGCLLTKKEKEKKGGLVEVSSGIYERGERWGVSEDVMYHCLMPTICSQANTNSEQAPGHSRGTIRNNSVGKMRQL